MKVQGQSLGPSPSISGLPTPGELAELTAARSVGAVELSPELVRLGAELPTRATREPGAHVRPPELDALREIARIGAHLGGLERLQRELSGPEAGLLAERLSRIHVLVDCATALADLRDGVAGAMRVARPA